MNTLKRCILFTLFFLPAYTNAQTALTAGDIAIVGIYCYNDATYDDSFAFVTLKDLAAGTVIYFTDKGWTEAGAFYLLSPAGETTITYTAPAFISAGTVLYFYSTKPGSSAGFSITNNNTFSTIGDQLIAYQGSESSPVLLYALNIAAVSWLTTPGATQSTTNSWLPTGLVTGTTAISFSAGADNAVYSAGSNTNLTTLRTMIGNTANWTTGTTTTRPAFPSGPLPVELTTFSAVNKNGQVMLHWTTASEVNNAGFAVERCKIKVAAESGLQQSNNRNWKQIGYVPGAGNSNSTKIYSFIDTRPESGILLYRLKQTDNNGEFKYHPSTEITFLPEINKLYQNYPNPFNPETKISYSIITESLVSLKIFNVLGSEVANLIREVQTPGVHEFLLNAEKLGLASGLYYYRIDAGSYQETKKMLLIK